MGMLESVKGLLGKAAAPITHTPHGTIRTTKDARRAGESHEFTLRRQKSRAKSRAAKAARKR
jgi:hypothetical protein